MPDVDNTGVAGYTNNGTIIIMIIIISWLEDNSISSKRLQPLPMLYHQQDSVTKGKSKQNWINKSKCYCPTVGHSSGCHELQNWCRVFHKAPVNVVLLEITSIMEYT